MFNLDEAITDWRRQMAAGGIKSAGGLDEMEGHLREDVERQMKLGLNEVEAFRTAVQRIGPVQAVRNEFKKVEAAREGRRWRAFEIAFLAAVLLNPLLVGGLAFFVKDGSFSEMTSGQQVSSLAAAAIFSLLAWAMRLSWGRFPVIRTNR